MNTYMLALGSSKHALPLSAYTHSVYHTYDSVRFSKIEDIDIDIFADSLSADSIVQSRVQVLRRIDTLVQVPIIDSLSAFGEHLLLGDIRGSLLDLDHPFLTVKPEAVSDSVFRWSDILKAYVRFVKRRDNELGVGVNASDIWGFYQYGRYGGGGYRINPVIGPGAIIVDRPVGESALLGLYHKFGPNLFTEYGFRSWFDLRNDDVSDEYLAVNQATLAVMIENARNGFIWDLYGQIPELQLVRSKLFARGSVK